MERNLRNIYDLLHEDEKRGAKQTKAGNVEEWQLSDGQVFRFRPHGGSKGKAEQDFIRLRHMMKRIQKAQPVTAGERESQSDFGIMATQYRPSPATLMGQKLQEAGITATVSTPRGFESRGSLWIPEQPQTEPQPVETAKDKEPETTMLTEAKPVNVQLNRTIDQPPTVAPVKQFTRSQVAAVNSAAKNGTDAVKKTVEGISNGTVKVEEKSPVYFELKGRIDQYRSIAKHKEDDAERMLNEAAQLTDEATTLRREADNMDSLIHTFDKNPNMLDTLLAMLMDVRPELKGKLEIKPLTPSEITPVQQLAEIYKKTWELAKETLQRHPKGTVLPVQQIVEETEQRTGKQYNYQSFYSVLSKYASQGKLFDFHRGQGYSLKD